MIFTPDTLVGVRQFLYEGRFDAYDWLISQPSEEVLNHAYEYTCREDILLSLEYNDLSPRQAKALLKSPTPLADVFKKWEATEDNHHMENIWNAVEARANEVVRADFIAQKDAR